MPESAPLAIRAVFAEWRMVKTRKVLALVFEVPLETQGEVLTMLGAPMPDAEIWCGIARLNLDVAKPDPAISPASQRGKERYANSTPMEQAVIRAARLAKDDRFRAWIAQTRWNGRAGDMASEHTCIEHIRATCCDGGSRGLIAEDPECYQRYIELESAFKIAVGELAEPR